MTVLISKPDIVFTESRAIPKRIKLWVFQRDGGKCIKCETKISLEYDHVPEWALLEPKRHDPDKIFLLCKPCHDPKSRRNTTEIARAKRLRKAEDGHRRKFDMDASENEEDAPTGFPRGAKRKIQSPGFPKGGTKQKIQSPGFPKKGKTKWKNKPNNE